MATVDSRIGGRFTAPQRAHHADDAGSWSSIQTLFSSHFASKKHDDNKALGPYTLRWEMCTEALGDENGTDSGYSISAMIPGGTHIAASARPISQHPRETTTYGGIERQKTTRGPERLKFPPPLSSMSGFNGVQLLHHRKNGKLVMEAVHRSCMSEERVEGRLRLNIFKQSTVNALIIGNTSDETVSEVAEVAREVDNDGIRFFWEDGGHAEEEVRWERKTKVGDEGVDLDIVGLEEYRRPSRCKEGEVEKSINWQRFWVVTLLL